MNTKKNQFRSKSAQSELLYQESLNSISIASSVKDSKLLQEKLFYVAPAMRLFSASDIILNNSSGSSDSIAAFAQS